MELLFQRTPGTSWVRDVVDILIVAFLVFRLLKLIRGTRAWRILGGVVAFVVVWAGAEFFGLQTLAWLMKQLVPVAPFAIALLLLPELRAMLEGFGRIGLIPQLLVRPSGTIGDSTIESIVSVSMDLASKHVGALLVIERGASLHEIVASGVPLGAPVTKELLGSIFYGSNPLHDGAAVIRGDLLVAAACRLPLSDNPRIDPRLHLRHRAGIGVTEALDCVSVIVSEERGIVTIASNGEYHRANTAAEMRRLLEERLRNQPKDEEREPRWKRKERRNGQGGEAA